MNKKFLHLLLVLLCLQLNVSSQNCSFSLSENHQNTTCPNSEDGAISLTISGVLPFSLVWSKQNDPTFQSTSQQLNNLAAGIYTALVIDSLACQESLVVTITNGIDFTPPILQCPGNQFFNLPTGACSKIFNFTVSATDNCTNPTILQTDNSGWSSGDAFPIGTHQLSFSATDGFQTNTCNFSITVNEFQLLGSPNMSCTSGINVSVGEDCEPNLHADLVLVSTQHGCYDDYILEYRSANGILITNFSNYIGQTISVKVKDPDSGNNCSASVTLYDNLKPYFLPTDTLQVPCGTTLANLHPSIIGMPSVVENCSNYTTTFTDQLTPIGCQDPNYLGVNAVLRRTWLATDQYNNISNPFVQVIFFTRKTLADVVFPLNRNDLAGQMPSLPCGTTQTQPIFTGTPTIDGISIIDGGPYCNFAVNFTDVQIQGCGNSYDILRTWTVFDECLSTIKTQLQVIQIRDKIAPVMLCPANFSVSTNQNNCGASFFLPPLVSISDNCSGYSVSAQTTGGPILNNVILNMAMGTHTLTYKAIDICGNQSQCQTQVTVFDGNIPSAICKPSKQVGLTSDGTASLTGLTFDNGSHDDCTSDANLKFKIKRLNDACNMSGTEFENSVKFCCSDVGTPVPVQIKITDLAGNFNVCNSMVLVNDLLAPTLFCPTDVQIDCNFDYANLSVFGKVADSQVNRLPIIINGQTVGQDGLGTDNCSVTIEELATTQDISDCGEGTLTRKFKVTDLVGFVKTCVQHIYIENNDPFYINAANLQDPNDDAIFPANVVLNGCNVNTSPAFTGQPILLNDNCALVSFTHNDQIFNQPGNSYLIARKWTIIDFCQLNGSQGIWYYTQNITVQNSDVLPPQISGIAEVWNFCSQSIDCTTGAVNFSLLATDNCTPSANLLWSYKMDLFNDGSIDIYGNSGALSGQFPIGIHRVQYEVADASGNVATIAQFVVVEDCLAPILQCPDVTVVLDETGLINLQSADFQEYANENCSDNGEVDLFLSFYDATYTDVLPSNQSATFLAFGCPDTLYHLTLFAGDESENWSKCDFHLKVYDALGNCNDGEPAVSISGNILTEEGDIVELVEVNINNASPATSANGFYAFYSLPLGGDFSVIPFRNENHLNGVTTFDLVRIRKHVLNVQLLDSPYKMIAADANKSGSITTLDLVEIQKLILGNITQFQYNTSWRFVDANFVFPNPANPFATNFPESISYNNLFNSEIANFIAIKIGDVNNSANPANLLAADNRSEETPAEIIYTAEEVTISDFAPNPMETTSNINFYLPESETVKLRIVDQQGKLMGFWEKEYEKGWQTWQIDAVILKNRGIYFYEMTVGEVRKSGKVVRN